MWYCFQQWKLAHLLTLHSDTPSEKYRIDVVTLGDSCGLQVCMSSTHGATVSCDKTVVE